MVLSRPFTPAGTGTLLHYDGHEYVVTALHVAQDCGFEPLIDVFGQWTPSVWEVIGEDKDCDIAVLERIGENDKQLARLTATYGLDRVAIGSVAMALGFPDATEPIEWMRTEGDLRPAALPVPTMVYNALADRYYAGGYVNHGFSGGPIVAWAENHPTIIGIITQKAQVFRPDGMLEHAGLVGVTFIDVAGRFVANHRGHTLEEFKEKRPKSKQDRAPFRWETLYTGEICDAVVRLGKQK